MGKIKRWAVEPDESEEVMKECDRLVDIRMAEKFGVKPTYENWEFDEAFVELEDEGALPGQGTEYPAWRWLVQVDDNAQIATKTVRIAKLLVESCVDGDAFIDDGITTGISLPRYSERAVRVALEALAQCGHLTFDGDSQRFRPQLLPELTDEGKAALQMRHAV
jgi:hypothetical protein